MFVNHFATFHVRHMSHTNLLTYTVFSVVSSVFLILCVLGQL